MTYDEILESRTPKSSRSDRPYMIPAPTRENTNVESPTFSRTYKPPPKQSAAQLHAPTSSGESTIYA